MSINKAVSILTGRDTDFRKWSTHSGVWTLPPIQVYNLKWILDLMERATKTSHASFLVPKSASILAF
jgi:hypothetical protein